MSNKRGFTLIELLVVIAIITILAATVAPRVSNWISRGRMARATSEIRNADLALVKMLADADRKDFGTFFKRADTTAPVSFGLAMLAMANTLPAGRTIYDVYTDMFYELLRRGKDATLTDLVPAGYVFDGDVARKLGTSYMDIGRDPWGSNYIFFPGPIRTGIVPFRSRRLYDDGTLITYNNAGVQFMNNRMRGNPPADGLPGYPAPRDLPVYIYSMGENKACEQLVLPGMATVGDIYTTFDDINNWDSESGWSDLY